MNRTLDKYGLCQATDKSELAVVLDRRQGIVDLIDFDRAKALVESGQYDYDTLDMQHAPTLKHRRY